MDRLLLYPNSTHVMRIFSITVFLLGIPLFVSAQSENWDTYLGEFENGPGSVSLNLGLMKEAPKREFPYIIITGVTFAGCRADGLPQPEAFDNLYAISDDVNRFIKTITQSNLAGSFTYQCKRLDYVYVSDTVGVRKKLVFFYTSKYKLYRYHLAIKPDKDWNAYINFLYPNEETLEYMANARILYQLKSEGDKLDKPRLIEHWLYFEDSNSRDTFIKYAEAEKFKVEDKAYLDNVTLHYQLHISRVDSVDAGFINALTIRLKRKANELGGNYDGWETILIKDE
jgi:hypothetical protein